MQDILTEMIGHRDSSKVSNQDIGWQIRMHGNKELNVVMMMYIQQPSKSIIFL